MHLAFIVQLVVKLLFFVWSYWPHRRTVSTAAAVVLSFHRSLSSLTPSTERTPNGLGVIVFGSTIISYHIYDGDRLSVAKVS